MNATELQDLIDRAAGFAPGEVVTRALSRDVVLPHVGRTAVLITLDNGQDHTRPNTLGPRGLGEFNAALDAAFAREDIAAILYTDVARDGTYSSPIENETRRFFTKEPVSS